MPLLEATTTLEVGAPPLMGERKTTFKVLFHRFKDIKAESISSPEFEYDGRKWRVVVYPRGDAIASNGYISVYLYPGDSGKVLFNNVLVGICHSSNKVINSRHYNLSLEHQGWPDFIKFSYWDMVDKNGTLAIVVSFNKEEGKVIPIVPRNTYKDLMQELLFDEVTSDVCFEVSNSVIGTEPTRIFAHRLILTKCAPMLAALLDGIDKLDGLERVKVVISDIKPEVLRLLLTYVYGQSILVDDMIAQVKDIISAADKYSIVNLKLEAEVSYVKFTKITIANVIDNLMYADAMNLALLKEAVMDFLAENNVQAVKNVSFSDVPGRLMKDLLVAMYGKNKGSKVEDLDVMCVSELRAKLDELGATNVDGSREAMIHALKAVSESGSDTEA